MRAELQLTDPKLVRVLMWELSGGHERVVLATKDGAQSGRAPRPDVACANRQSEDLALDSERLIARKVKTRSDEHAER